MTLDELKSMVEAAHPLALITLPAPALKQALAEVEKSVGDLTIEEYAKRYKKSAATVRSWCANGILSSAYKAFGSWRIPRNAKPEERKTRVRKTVRS